MIILKIEARHIVLAFLFEKNVINLFVASNGIVILYDYRIYIGDVWLC